MLNFFLTKKVVVRFILFYTFFTDYLSQKGFCAPSVARTRHWNSGRHRFSSFSVLLAGNTVIVIAVVVCDYFIVRRCYFFLSFSYLFSFSPLTFLIFNHMTKEKTSIGETPQEHRYL